MKISQKLLKLRLDHGMTQNEMSKIAEVSNKSVSAWESGSRAPKLRAIQNLCNHFHLDLSSFIDETIDDFVSAESQIANLLSLPTMRRIPLIGTIACGTPITADENLEGSVDLPEHIRADFALRCRGDSMINARIFDGDIVYIRQQDTVDSGEIAAVLIDDEATLKRVRIYSDHLTLEPENPLYRPLSFWDEDMNRIRILGKAVAFTSCIT